MHDEVARSERGGAARRSWIERHKPAASRRVHLAAAGTMWSLAGAGLATAGLVWILRAAGRWTALAIAFALVLGAVKGHLVLRRAARRNVARIEARGDGRCLGGFLGPRGWALVAAMIVGGRLLRASPIPRPVLGTLYLGVGAALFVASFEIWRARRRASDPARRRSPP